MLPLNVISWEFINKESKEWIWEEVKANTNAPDEFKRICLLQVAQMWRGFKSELKRKYYNIWNTDEERLANVPDQVVPDQWKSLVRYWGDEKVQSVSEQNKNNSKKQRAPHRKGKKSFARVRAKMKQQGKPVDECSVFFETRTDKDGNVKESGSNDDVFTQLKNKVSQLSESEQTLEALSHAFIDVMGPNTRGRVRTMGLGPTSTMVYGRAGLSSKNCPSRESMKAELREELRAEMMAEMDVKVAEINSYWKARFRALESTVSCQRHATPPHASRSSHGIMHPNMHHASQPVDNQMDLFMNPNVTFTDLLR